MKTFLLLLTNCTLLLLSCKKDSLNTSPDARVNFSADKLQYDTVFTTAGSVTQSFRIINENNQRLRLSSVTLMGGSSSPFKINVDGIATNQATNIEIDANDSLYVFVQVNIDPTAGPLPFIIRDSIRVSYNGRDKFVQLEAWGQNAHFLTGKEVLTNETWTNDLPYVILGYLYVDLNQTLTIGKGCRVYVHADAPIIIDGTLKVNGERDSIDRVYFQGDRLDDPYRDFPAGWPGIYFRADSKDNELNYAVVRNAYQAIATEDPSPNVNPKLTMNQCVIDNAYDFGVISLNSSIDARNCVVSNCGKNIGLAKGGSYRFTHCTVASFSNEYIQHKDPVLTVSNTDGSSTAPLNALFRNCIFWGNSDQVEDEVVVIKSPADVVTFDHNLWKVKTVPQGITANEIINNQDPLFDSINVSKHYYDFRISQRNSPAVDKGTAAGLTVDLDGNIRSVGPAPDLGAYEKQ